MLLHLKHMMTQAQDEKLTFALAGHTSGRNAPARPANCSNWGKTRLKLSKKNHRRSKMSHCRLGKTSKTRFYRSRLAGRVNQNEELKPLWPPGASPGRDALTSTIAPGHIWIVGIEHIWIFASGGGFNCDRGWVNGLKQKQLEMLKYCGMCWIF